MIIEKERLGRSNEDYLKTIYILRQERGYARIVDIAEELSVANPSVSHAVKVLIQEGYLEKDKAGFVVMTKKGEEIARKLIHKHDILEDFLVMLGVDKSTASKDAHNMEHYISDVSASALEKHMILFSPMNCAFTAQLQAVKAPAAGECMNCDRNKHIEKL
jgi:Mn-dependent DtxR family transcriptional regulator